MLVHLFFDDSFWRVVTGLRPRHRTSPMAIGELYFCTGEGFYPVSMRDRFAVSPLPAVSLRSSVGASASAPACVASPVSSPVREVPRLTFSFASPSPTIIKGKRKCYFMDCAAALGLPSVDCGLVPSLPPLPQYDPSVPGFAYVGLVISRAWLAENVTCVRSEPLLAASVASSLPLGVPCSVVSCSGASSSVADMVSSPVSAPVASSWESLTYSTSVEVMGRSASSSFVSGVAGSSPVVAAELSAPFVETSLVPAAVSEPSANTVAEIVCPVVVPGPVAVTTATVVPRPVAIPRPFSLRRRSGAGRSARAVVAISPAAVSFSGARLSPSENVISGVKRNMPPPSPPTSRRRRLSCCPLPEKVSLAVSSVPVVSSVSSVPAVGVVEASSISVSPARPIAMPCVSHYEKAREKQSLRDLFDAAEKEVGADNIHSVSFKRSYNLQMRYMKQKSLSLDCALTKLGSYKDQVQGLRNNWILFECRLTDLCFKFPSNYIVVIVAIV
ncbi:uncharacterized protein EV154DRAFT_488275 [Mucor mucedo]|uniref:uncharacterized protein n=1 Tax=Mucor mucedo TaxID=29922 RepID=UPI0022205E4D|nr:uncharacterized protein EV154DRAFT_488275 [Mucor mucedo]KAI7867760.1 hypothetical protein EV154DRAFT_488275 [Mucor mucedo]